MKIPLVLITLILGGGLEAAEPADPNVSDRPQPARYDTDKDGTLSGPERRAYLQAVLEERRERQRSQALNRPVLTPAMKRLVEPQVWTKEKKAQYDLNRNGTIEPHESGRERIDAMKAAREKFRKLDLNGDGELDAQELQAAGLPVSAEVPAAPGK